MNSKRYLGDSVYVQIGAYGDVILTTENGAGASNQIVLDPAVLASFQEWLRDMRRQVDEQKDGET